MDRGADLLLMLPRNTIFDSSSEQELFAAIEGAWQPQYRLYPHIPFANLVDLDPQFLDAAEISYLNKASVDFVLTAADGRPLLGIEFDGLGHGYSRNGTYIEIAPSKRDRSRGWRLGLKARVAHSAMFPFLVVSYEEKGLVDEDTNLTVLHGIVGSYVSSRHLGALVQERVAEAEEYLARLSPEEQQEEIQDIVLCAEVETNATWNPVTHRAHQLSGRLRELDPNAVCRYSYREDPPRPPNTSPWKAGFDGVAFQHWWRNVRRFGCDYHVRTRAGVVRRCVWMRNFEGDFFTPHGILDEVAEVVAVNAAIALLEGRAA